MPTSSLAFSRKFMWEHLSTLCIVSLAVSIPVSTALAERTFSNLKRIETYRGIRLCWPDCHHLPPWQWRRKESTGTFYLNFIGPCHWTIYKERKDGLCFQKMSSFGKFDGFVFIYTRRAWRLKWASDFFTWFYVFALSFSTFWIYGKIAQNWIIERYRCT